MALTVFATAVARQIDAERSRSAFELAILHTEAEFAETLGIYTTMLRGARGLFAAVTPVAPTEFRAYVEQLDLDRRFPGVQGIGYAREVTDQEKDELIQSLLEQGQGDFVSITPLPERGRFNVVVYLEPHRHGSPTGLGYDMLVDPVLRRAADQARDTGELALSDRVMLVTAAPGPPTAGLVACLPLYRSGKPPPTIAERRAELIGFVYSPLRADQMFQHRLGSPGGPPVAVRVYYGEGSEPERLLFDGARSELARQPRHSALTVVELGGKKWTLAVSSLPEFERQTDSSQVPFVFLTGLVVSLTVLAIARARASSAALSARYLFELDRHRAQLERDEEAQRFFAGASRRLMDSLDVDRSLSELARLVVPQLADWCAIELREPSGQTREVIAGRGVAGEVRAVPKDQLPGDTGRPPTSSSLESLLFPRFQEQSVELLVSEPEGQRQLHALHPESAMVVPLPSRRGAVGRISLVSVGRAPYGERELAMAQELGRRAGVALENARLYAEAEQAIRFRERILAIVSHDLKTPLATLHLALPGLVKVLGGARPEQRDPPVLDRIWRALDQMSRLISDLTDLEAIRAGRLSIETRAWAIGPLVEETIGQFEERAKAKRIHLSTDLADRSCWVLCDRERIVQVLSNLLGNAVKFCRQDETISLSILAQRESMLFCVADTGPGIAADELPHVFDLYWSGKEHQKAGAGLGLFVSKSIIEAHGGHLWARSTLGAGTTFCFTLPRADRAPDQNPQPP